ncbi:peroxiredoxin-like family protein [Streptomyces reniochalinae]|uniref:thioredoxin-dependent peroxiredoxin n=1 Tax=Streptomyces reniochalinae TaxID=2250578 RepID=A0A367EHX8_9ACTN|nr:peroxiredoxin-like family protein [Streptomyces reniochalinae]RCG17573.1 AhpC/TSA family protein [Streptomyces reniochalinae]
MTVRTYAEQVAEFHARTGEQIPEEQRPAFAVLRAEQERLAAEGVPAGAAKPGIPLPDAALLDPAGAPTTLSAACGGRPTVLVLYRGAWCPYCNLALRTYQQELLPALVSRGVELVAVSPQRPDGSLTTQEVNELSFTVLSDPGNQIGRALGVMNTWSAQAREAVTALVTDVSAANSDGTDDVPMPTVALVDAQGVVRWLDVHPDYASRTEPAAVLEALALLD